MLFDAIGAFVMAEAFRLDTRKWHVFFTATPSY
jgi:hypothetical protein